MLTGHVMHKLHICFWPTCIRRNFVFILSIGFFSLRCVAFSFSPLFFLYLVTFVTHFIFLSYGNVAVTGKFYLDLS